MAVLNKAALYNILQTKTLCLIAPQTALSYAALGFSNLLMILPVHSGPIMGAAG